MLGLVLFDMVVAAGTGGLGALSRFAVTPSVWRARHTREKGLIGGKTHQKLRDGDWIVRENGNPSLPVCCVC